MRIQRRKAAAGRANRFVVRVLTLLAVLLISTALIDMRVRPIAEEVIRNETQSTAFRIINNAMLQALEQNGATYNDLVRLTRAEDGSVLSIETDIVAVNRLKSQISVYTSEALELPEYQTLHLPLGTLLNSNLTSGRGPMIEIRLLPTGYVYSSLTNAFSSAGINQTLHQIMLETTVQLSAVLPGSTVTTETTSCFCVAETVIVGDIPDGYAAIGENAAPFLAKSTN